MITKKYCLDDMTLNTAKIVACMCTIHSRLWILPVKEFRCLVVVPSHEQKIKPEVTQHHAFVNEWNTTKKIHEIHVSQTSLTGFLSIRLNVGSENLQNESRK